MILQIVNITCSLDENKLQLKEHNKFDVDDVIN